MTDVRRRHELSADGPQQLIGKMDAFGDALRLRGGRILEIEWLHGGSSSARAARILYMVPVPGPFVDTASD